MRRLRRTALSICAAALLGLTMVPGSSVADPKPTIQEVKRQVAQLDHEAEQASERFNALREQLKQIRQRLSAVSADARRQDSRVELLQGQVAQVAVARFQGSTLGSTASLLLAPNPDRFLSTLSTLESVDATQSQLLTDYLQQSHELAAQQAQVQEQLDAIAKAKSDMAEEKAAIHDKSEQAKDVLAQLEEKQRLALLAAAAASRADAVRPPLSTSTPVSTGTTDPSTPTTSTPTTPATSDRASIAVDFALAQLGDPYVYGAAGPDAWDCSGLTMGAWGAAGVSLPHASSMQPSYGTPVSISDLQPGDLVFYYSPISHVAIYLGNGQIIHAPHTGDVVRIAPLDEMPIAMAVRPG
jgi:cell wall-associated NlpC family hydrolase